MSTSIKSRRVPGARPTSGRNVGRSMKTQEKSYHADGIYNNIRYTHVATSLIGCNVQVQVKNKDIYDGVLVTVSPEMKIVLKKAHKVSELGSNTTPSKDLLEETVIYNISDVVAINVSDVDLEYAVKDSFTDSSISKFNGQSGEKELTPWECEGGDQEIVLENEASNGWDPYDMFKTNREQFNVQSTYDEKLSQYTTVLDKSNENYRKREEAASKLAQEIERTDGYRARIDLENGDGDEEDRFSAVVRPRENSPKIGNGTGKYIPPNQRVLLAPHGDGLRRPSPSRNSQGGHHRMGNTHPPQMVQHPAHNSSGSAPVPPQQNIHIQLSSQSSVSSTSPMPSPQTPPAKLTEQQQQKTEKNDVNSEPVVHSVNTEDSNGGSIENTTNTSPNSKSSVSRDELKRVEQTRELREFSHQFKLSEGEAKAESDEKTTDSERTNEQKEQKESDKDNKDKQLAETVKKSTLNPNAKEFVFNPTKSFQPKHSNANTPTPPRQHTQSPIIHQPLGPMPHMYTMLPMPTHMPGQQMAMSQGKLTKKAVVSVTQRSDFNAAAQAATGQPLLAQTTGGPFVQYQIIPGGMPQHPSYQMMPVNHGTRMPPNVSVMSNNGQGQEHNPQYSMPLFMTPPVPAHLPQPHQPPTPAHMNQHHVAHHSQPQHQVGQMGHQSGGHHPSPSPVQHHGGLGSQQPHPPGSGTPQPHIIYPGGGMGQQNHPPLQASPHNPTSPSALHHLPMPSYTFNHGPAMQGGPPMSLPQAHPPSSGHQMMHVAHSHMGAGPHTMMIPHPQAHGQMHPHGQIQHGHFPHQMQGTFQQAHVGGQGHGGHIVQQSGMIPVSQSSNLPYIQHHQVPNQALPQGYPHNQ